MDSKEREREERVRTIYLLLIYPFSPASKCIIKTDIINLNDTVELINDEI